MTPTVILIAFLYIWIYEELMQAAPDPEEDGELD